MYEPHELALLLPPMAGDQREELKNDIEANGLVDAITLYEGKVLDGVHRQAICAELGVEPRYEQFAGASPVAFVASKNVHRRHLTPSQLAAVGAELVPRFEAEAKKRMTEGARKAGQGRLPSVDGSLPRTAAEDAAKVVGVSPSSVERARRVQKADPKVFKDQKAGKISGREALRRVTRSPNWNGKTNAARERELHERKRKRKGKQPDKYIDLLRLQMGINRYTRLLESWHLHEYEFDLETTWLMVDIHDDLISLGEWHDRTLSAVQAWLVDGDVREKIAKLRDTAGRTDEEAETALRLADRLERKLEARLTR